MSRLVIKEWANWTFLPENAFLYTKSSYKWTGRNLFQWKFSISCNQMNIEKNLRPYFHHILRSLLSFPECFHWVGYMKTAPHDIISLPWCASNGGTHGAVSWPDISRQDCILQKEARVCIISAFVIEDSMFKSCFFVVQDEQVTEEAIC